MDHDTLESRRVPEEWITLLEQMIDESIEREGGIQLSAEDLQVDVPLAFGEDADRAEWGFDGSVTVETKGTRGSLAEWFHLHHESLPAPGENGLRRPSDTGDSDE
ncbi:hypothetical protein [Halobaculum saliterrae]|uniref:hypothetical protein n=1 Tax=Halobaculum saliterrae TaxID=2073113 RepID=UPI0019152CE5|nr:hypothetical protein [Halobaculum saliterrae]